MSDEYTDGYLQAMQDCMDRAVEIGKKKNQTREGRFQWLVSFIRIKLEAKQNDNQNTF